jgi:hypothetical protein
MDGEGMLGWRMEVRARRKVMEEGRGKEMEEEGRGI